MMCTGYTSLIINGKIKTAKDFMKVCLRNFGVLVDFRDEELSANIPTELKVRKYYYDEVTIKQEQYDKEKNYTDKEWKKIFNQKILELQKQCDSCRQKAINESIALKRIKDAIENWQDSGKYAKVKDFALEQLSKTEPDDYIYLDQKLVKYKVMGWKGYKEYQLEQTRDALETSKNILDEEENRVKERNEYLKGFLNEIGNIKEYDE